MRIATYEHDGATRAGIVEGDAVRPLGDGTDPISLLTMSPAQRASLPLGAPVALDAVRLRPPIRPPGGARLRRLRAARRGDGDGRGRPGREGVGRLVRGARLLLLQPQRAVRRPATTSRCRPAAGSSTTSSRWRRSSASRAATSPWSNAREHIAGYTIFNDWSGRDLQGFDRKAGMGWAKGKDFASTLGPWIVTADELEEHRDDVRAAGPHDDRVAQRRADRPGLAREHGVVVRADARLRVARGVARAR